MYPTTGYTPSTPKTTKLVHDFNALARLLAIQPGSHTLTRNLIACYNAAVNVGLVVEPTPTECSCTPLSDCYACRHTASSDKALEF